MAELLPVTASRVSAQLRRAALNPGRYRTGVREGTRVKQAGRTAVTVVFSFDYVNPILPLLVADFTETLRGLGYTIRARTADHGMAAFITVTRPQES